MQIGNVLESKILQGYCKLQQLNLKKERGGVSLTLLYQYNYVGHTPDGKTVQSKGDDAEVLEVKVVFSSQETLAALFKKHTPTAVRFVCTSLQCWSSSSVPLC